MENADSPWALAMGVAGVGVLIALNSILLAFTGTPAPMASLSVVSFLVAVFGLGIAILGFYLVVNPYRHRSIGIAIMALALLNYPVIFLGVSSSILMPLLPLAGLFAGVGAIIYSPGRPAPNREEWPPALEPEPHRVGGYR